jgi:hypothetical protein
MFFRRDYVLDADDDFSGKDRKPGLRIIFQLDAHTQFLMLKLDA